ncbi:MAG: hypothetical protein HY820_25445 [Acidobacteria bacterium]|nr:hypothetical protein [Acidobacteriota bacterium]
MTPFILRFAEPLAAGDPQGSCENSDLGQGFENPEERTSMSDKSTRFTMVKAETTDDA